MREWGAPGYTEVRVLGSGGFGEVVLARHVASGTLVAVKYLHRSVLADDPEFAGMFRAEARVLASLDDPNVVRLYEYVESPAGAAIVMELVDGVSLREIVSRYGKTSAELALVVLQGSLLGLAAAHARGVVHRDYKPENVLVNGAGVSKLTDFGIAARAGDRPVPAGTLAYAPPEQLAGGPATPATDVYAATATFYECLAGHPPFAGDTAEALIYQHRSQPVPLEPVPVPLRPLVAAGMAKDPAGRPADAARFVAELRAVAGPAYGPGWEDRGRSHLGEAALLLAALWPSGAAPAVGGHAAEQVRLSRPGQPSHSAQPSQGAQPSHGAQPSQESPGSEHLEHLRHVEHLRHLEHVEHLEQVEHPGQPGQSPPGHSGEPAQSPPGHSGQHRPPRNGQRALRAGGRRTLFYGAAAAAVAVIVVLAILLVPHGHSLAASGGAGGSGGSGSGATAAHVVKVPPAGPNGWAYGALFEGAPVINVSCPTTTFCMAADDSYDSYIFNGSEWAGPIVIDQAAQAAAQNGSGSDYLSVSCATPQFCAAVDYNGGLYTFNGTSWSPRKTLSKYGGLSVSCPTAGFCLAMDNDGNAYTYSGGTWTTRKGVAPAAGEISQENAVYQVSCASASFCAIVSATGSALTYNGTSFTAPVTIDAVQNSTLMNVSCPSAAFCMAIDAGGKSFTFDGTSWKASDNLRDAGGDGGVGCASASLCMTLDTQGNLLWFTGSAWNLDESFIFTGSSDGMLAAGVSCPSAKLCVAVGEGHYGIWR
jgi:serine/threonine protein kinase